MAQPENHKTGSIYVTALEPKSGKLMVTLGLMEVITRLVSRVGFFRPVIRSGKKPDNDLSLILERYNLDISYDEAHVFTVEEVQALGAQGRFKDIVQAIIERYNKIKSRFEFILCEGFESSGISAGFDVDANINISKNLGSPILGVLSGRNKQEHEITESLKIVLDAIDSEGCFNVAAIVNRVAPELVKKVWQRINREVKGDVPVYVIPEVPELASPTIGEIMEGLGCSFIHGDPSGLNRVIRQFKIAAMTLDNYLSYLEDGDLIITPGDREDILVGTLTTLFSHTFPNISGIMLTGGLKPGPRVTRLIQGLRQASIPLIGAADDTFTSAMKASQVPALISKDNPRKVDVALGTFESAVNINEIRRRLAVSRSEIVTPLMFQYSLFERAREEIRHLVLPEGDEERILRASEVLRARNVVNLTLIGKEERIREKAAILGVELDGVEIVDHVNSPLLEEFIEEFYELRKCRGGTMDSARDAMLDENYFGVMMVYKGLVDGMVSGAVHTTADVLRPAFQIIKTRPGVKIASSVFFMCLPTRVLVFGDCAVNPDPDAEELAAIAISSADTAATFDIEPRVAMLSYSTGSSGKGKDVEKVKRAVEIARKLRPDLLIEGPLQYDAAIDPGVAKKKLPGSKVAGKATVFIFPDLNTGNNTYKAVQRSSGAIAIGPVIQGLRKPVNDLSRGCLVEDVVNTVAITAVQAGQK